jgi:hypothetical protein
VSPTYVSLLERGREVPSPAPALHRLAAALAVSLPELLDKPHPGDAGWAAARLAPDAGGAALQRLIKVGARIRPALWPYLLELANTLATISRLLDTDPDPERESAGDAATSDTTPPA